MPSVTGQGRGGEACNAVVELLPLLKADEVGLLLLEAVGMERLQLLEDAVLVVVVLPQDWARVDGDICSHVLEELVDWVDWLGPC